MEIVEWKSLGGYQLEESQHVHNYSGFFPEIPLPGGASFPTYFIIISLAFCVSVLWLVRRTERRGLDRNTALDLALVVMGFGFLGARLFHVFFEEPSYYLDDPLRVFEFWQGGFVWYGGALFAALAGFTYVRRKKLNFGIWLDLVAPIAALGYAIGRTACVLAGCCFGAICTLASGFSFRYPTQLFSVVWELSVLGFILWLEHQRDSQLRLKLKPHGMVFLIWLALHSLGRIIMEAFRADPRGPEPLGLSLAMWISLALLISAIYFASKLTRKRA